LNIQLQKHKLLLGSFCVILEALHLQPPFIVVVWKRATNIFFRTYHFTFHNKKKVTGLEQRGSPNNIKYCIQS